MAQKHCSNLDAQEVAGISELFFKLTAERARSSHRAEYEGKVKEGSCITVQQRGCRGFEGLGDDGHAIELVHLDGVRAAARSIHRSQE